MAYCEKQKCTDTDTYTGKCVCSPNPASLVCLTFGLLVKVCFCSSCLGLVVLFFGISEGHLNSANVLAVTAGVGVAGYLITRTKLTASGDLGFNLYM